MYVYVSDSIEWKKFPIIKYINQYTYTYYVKAPFFSCMYHHKFEAINMCLSNTTHNNSLCHTTLKNFGCVHMSTSLQRHSKFVIQFYPSLYNIQFLQNNKTIYVVCELNMTKKALHIKMEHMLIFLKIQKTFKLF